MFITDPEDSSQIRLTLKNDWILTLDSIADSRNMSRLALIRLYLEAGIKKDLQQVAETQKLKKDLQEQNKRHQSYTY